MNSVRYTSDQGLGSLLFGREVEMMRLLMVFGLIAALSGPAIAQDESPYFAEIPAKLLRILDTQIAPLLQVGELDQATDLLMVMLPKADPKVVDAIDQRLKDLKLPAGSELFTDRVIRRVEAGLARDRGGAAERVAPARPSGRSGSRRP